MKAIRSNLNIGLKILCILRRSIFRQKFPKCALRLKTYTTAKNGMTRALPPSLRGAINATERRIRLPLGCFFRILIGVSGAFVCDGKPARDSTSVPPISMRRTCTVCGILRSGCIHGRLLCTYPFCTERRMRCSVRISIRLRGFRKSRIY